MRNLSLVKCMASASVVMALAGAASAAPTVDGKFDLSEGYTGGQLIDFVLSGGTSTLAEKGQMWWTQDDAGDLYFAAIFSKDLVDNTYGTNAIGWNRGHKFSDLVGSDQGTFLVRNDKGDSVFNFKMDYISQVKGANGLPTTYQSLGVTGGDGGILSKNTPAGWFLDGATSLEYNFNTLGYQLTQNSPAADDDYTGNTTHPGWIYEVIYEGKISGAAFGNNSFGSITVTDAHVSPPKADVTPRPGEVIPEPGTMALIATGGLLPALAIRRRRRA